MRTNEIALAVGVHPNTVRLYEDWGYISPVPRLENGYRHYNALHLQQMQIARLAFRQEFIQNNLRTMATKIVRLSGQQKFLESWQTAISYLKFLQSELNFAKQAVQLVDVLRLRQNYSSTYFTHRQAALELELSEETLRNWERNGLFKVERTSQNRRQYREQDLQKLLIIRTLRSAHFSIASILKLFEEIDSIQDVADIHAILNSTKFSQEFYHVTDELELNLKKAMKDVKSIIAILQKLQ